MCRAGGHQKAHGITEEHVGERLRRLTHSVWPSVGTAFSRSFRGHSSHPMLTAPQSCCVLVRSLLFHRAHGPQGRHDQARLSDGLGLSSGLASAAAFLTGRFSHLYRSLVSTPFVSGPYALSQQRQRGRSQHREPLPDANGSVSL